MASYETQWRGSDSASEFGSDDSVFPFFNSSPNRLDGRPRLLPSDQRPSGSISGPQLFPISEYPALVGIASLGDYAFLTNGGLAEPAAIQRPHSMADDVEYNLNYFNSYLDRSATSDNDTGSGSGAGYSYGLVPAPSLLAASGAPLPLNSSYMQSPHSSRLDSQSTSPIHTVVTSRLEPLDIVPTIPPAPDTRHVFFSDNGIYDVTSSAHDIYHLQQGLKQAQEPLVSASGGIQPSFSFSLPGMPNAEEAFLSQFQEPVTNIDPARVGEALTGEQQQGVHYPSTSDNQSTFDTLSGTDIFGTDQQDLVPRGGSPSTSDSSKSSQKRGRDQIELSTATPVKRQRVNRSEDNYVHRSTRKKMQNASFDFDLVFGSDDEGENDSGNDDSDAYIPSRSPSPVLPSFVVTSPSPSASPSIADELSTIVVKGKRGRGRGKGKAKGSAARALAMVTRAREEQDSLELRYPDLSDGDGLSIGGASTEGASRTRRAPLPVPVPNLIKKSRGRKVPYVPVLRGGEGIGEGVPVTDIVALTPSGRRGRRRTAANDLDDDASAVEERTFICMVPGCGKCFVRGEHLKRHVRSIHTDDKPHVCPHKGCGKSFSRRDNLGQHVRIHLEE